MLTKSRLRLYWFMLVSGVIVSSLLPGVVGLRDSLIAGNITSNWLHFLVYALVATLPMLAWKSRSGLAVSLGVALLSVALQVLHGFTSGRVTDSHITVVNLLGVTSGILLGLNIRALQSQPKERSASNTDRQESDQG
jgi:hypothetical protein